MKKLIFTAIAFLVIVSVQAQKRVKTDNGGGKRKCGNEQKHQKRKAIAKKLNLSDTQKTEMKAIAQNQKPQLKAIKDDASLTKEQKKEKMKALKVERKAATDKVLTAEQKAQLETMKEKKQGKK